MLTIEEKINFIKVCDLVIEYNLQEKEKIEEKLYNEYIDEKTCRKQEKDIKQHENIIKDYTELKRKAILDIIQEEKFKEYKEILDKNNI